MSGEPKITVEHYVGHEVLSVPAAIEKLQRSIIVSEALGLPVSQNMHDMLAELEARL